MRVAPIGSYIRILGCLLVELFVKIRTCDFVGGGVSRGFQKIPRISGALFASLVVVSRSELSAAAPATW